MSDGQGESADTETPGRISGAGVTGPRIDLRDVAVRGAIIANVGLDRVAVNKQEFQEARNYHRGKSDRMLFFLLIVAASFILCIFYMLTHPPVATLQETVEKSDAARGERAVRESTSEWVSTANSFAWRVGLVFVLGWFVVFFGRLHSSHAQQAVFYQDRLAGLDAAEVLLRFGDIKSKDEVLRQMVTSYMSLDRNAFVAATMTVKSGMFSSHDVRALLNFARGMNLRPVRRRSARPKNN